MPASSPLAVLFLLLLGALLPASPVAAGDGSFGGRMAVVLHAAMTRGEIATTTTASAAAAMWQRRRLEEVVAPEFPSAAIGGPPGIGYSTFDPNHQSCVSNCAGKAQGAAYTRPCTYAQGCPQGHP